MRALRLLGYVWSAPYGAVGFFAMLLFLLLDWIESARWQDGAWEVVARGPFTRWMNRERIIVTPEGMRVQRWAGFTLGWTIFLWAEPTSPTTLPHEHRHVDQALVLGVFLPVIWIVSVAVQGYTDSVLEVDARKAASASLPSGGAENGKT